MNWPLATDTWGQEEQDAIQRVLASKRLTIGPEVEAFEKEFSQKLKVNHAVMCNSGSSANLLAVAAIHQLDDRRGDWVVPAIGWSTTYSPLHQYGQSMTVVDVARDNYSMDCQAMVNAIKPNTKGVMLVHPLGAACDFLIYQYAKQRGLWVIEDTCEALGSKRNGAYLGTLGDVGTFSFYFSHNIHTIEGGMLVTNDKLLAETARSLRSHGWTRGIQLLDDDKRGRYKPFNFVMPGYNLRPTEINAAVGREQLKKLDSLNAERRKNYDYLRRRLFDPQNTFSMEVIVQNLIQEEVPFAMGMTMETTFLEQHLDRLKVEGIESRPLIGGNILYQPVAQQYRMTTTGTPRADYLHKYGFYLGCPTFDIRDQIDNFVEHL